MTKVKNGHTVKVHYTGKLDDGSVFDSSDGKEPIEFEVGAGRMIEGFDKGVVDMQVGETKTVKIQCEKAYGQYREDMVAVLGREEVPVKFKLAKGMMLQFKTENHAPMMVTIKDFTDTHVTLDGNHALAGKDLTFDIELVEIV